MNWEKQHFFKKISGGIRSQHVQATRLRRFISITKQSPLGFRCINRAEFSKNRLRGRAIKGGEAGSVQLEPGGFSPSFLFLFGMTRRSCGLWSGQSWQEPRERLGRNHKQSQALKMETQRWTLLIKGRGRRLCVLRPEKWSQYAWTRTLSDIKQTATLLVA